MIEQRNMNCMINKSGGNSGKNTLNYRVSIPNTWAQQLGITKDNRGLIMTFDGEKIIITRSMDKQ